MINIHLVRDEKFINNAVENFEFYYPEQNYFIVDKKESEVEYVLHRDNVYFISFTGSSYLEEVRHILPRSAKFNLLVHYLSRKAALVALNLKSYPNMNRLYWIFYGADLYSYLDVYGKYKLYDYYVKGRDNKIKIWTKRIAQRYKYMNDFCLNLDYFCFWNHYDYELLCRNIKTNAKFKFFYYVDGMNIKLLNLPENSSTLNILVNHSASFSGNHLTILEKLKQIETKKLYSQIVLPLSYGPKSHANLIKMKVERYFPNRCLILDQFLPIWDYYNIINNCRCAIMGHRRQEAGGNIHLLLMNGTKVFLREDNNLLRYYRDLGCSIFSLENDMNSLDAFEPLTVEQADMNRKIMQKSLLRENIDKMMMDLFS